jgi:hypothetical protein
MSLGAKQGTTQTTQTSSPWDPQQPYIKKLFSRADQTYNANANPDMGLLNAASGQVGDTISGKYLDPYSNPYFGGALDRTMGDIKTKVNANFQGDNFGNSAHQEWLGKSLSDAALPTVANQYNAERGNQMQATGMAPGLSTTSAQFPWMNLQNYQQAISGNYGGTQTGQTPYFTNPGATAAGLGLGALSLMGAGGPFAAGGLLGGIFK